MHLVFGLIAVVPAPILAGTVYLPLAGTFTVDGVDYSTRAWASNSAVTPRSFNAVFIPDAQDGTAQRVALGRRTIAPGAAAVIAPLAPAGAFGLLEVSGAPQVVIDSRLVTEAGELADLALPVISSENVVAANSPVELQGLLRSTTARTAVVVVNTSHTASACSLAGRSAQGANLGQVSFAVKALSQVIHGDALGLLGQTELAGARVTVSCDKAFYAFGLVLGSVGDEAAVLWPATSLASTLTAPGGGGENCPAGALCFVRDGNYHTVTRENPKGRFVWDVPRGTELRSIEVNFRFTLHKWDKNPNGQYSFLYFTRQWKWYGHALANLGARQSGIIWGEATLDLPDGEKLFMRAFKRLVPGQSYNVRYLYDAEHHRIEYQVTNAETGEKMLDLSTSTRTDEDRIVQSEAYFGISFSNDYGTGNHVPFWASFYDLEVVGRL